eukprot:MONOS_11405.1-p1 / transcript=MONOS_11405.1 / gene=MONOS_11405 / organism=Monocercomonoides_exilis_PA203 / gene_product=14-3-3 protein epsilon, putative / transcript_product=14-3-3 protein epsilon, putative / location=Mono_scaffold00570:2519-4743(-) / protein_length=477 / sequence_SO=supercontig / SO=protein_coding / is_pseudo=false
MKNRNIFEMSDKEREEILFTAQLLKESSNFKELKVLMKSLVDKFGVLSGEERALFSYAYKNDIITKRDTWRLFSTVEQQEDAKGNVKLAEVVSEQRQRFEKEISDSCAEILLLLDTVLLPHADSLDARVFYLKMKGDYHRYQCEYLSGVSRFTAAENALSSYRDGCKLAFAIYPPTNPVRLSLAMNFSVFCMDILNHPESACRILKEAYDDALLGINDLSEEESAETIFIMQLMQDNFVFWTSPSDGRLKQTQLARDEYRHRVILNIYLFLMPSSDNLFFWVLFLVFSVIVFFCTKLLYSYNGEAPLIGAVLGDFGLLSRSKLVIARMIIGFFVGIVFGEIFHLVFSLCHPLPQSAVDALYDTQYWLRSFNTRFIYTYFPFLCPLVCNTNREGSLAAKFFLSCFGFAFGGGLSLTLIQIVYAVVGAMDGIFGHSQLGIIEGAIEAVWRALYEHHLIRMMVPGCIAGAFAGLMSEFEK